MTLLQILLLPVAGLALLVVSILSWIATTQVRYLLFHRRQGTRPPPLGPAGWLRFYARTVVGALLVVWWFFRAAFRDGLRRPAGGSELRPVLCIHGLFMNGSCMWGIRRALERRGRPTRAVFLGLPHSEPEDYSRRLLGALHEMRGIAGEEGFDVVAHSMGGLALRNALAIDSSLGESIQHIVTLGTPHQGTAVLDRVGFGPARRMMRRGSPFLAHLPTFAETTPATTVTTVGTQHDLVVYPADSAHLKGSRTVALTGVSHLGLLTEPEVLAVISSALGDRQS